jgi:precorrin-2/cobalt-factor-2 C20-methyltransferase
MTGKLYVIGVGPGDPELMTLKANRILREVDCLCIPKGREEGKSLALSIVREVIDLEGKELIEAYFPMRKTRLPSHGHELDSRWEGISAAILDRLRDGRHVAFVTIGDPTVYSTFFYLHERLLRRAPRLEIEIVPGVSSITASAARAGVPLGLGDGKIAILPANYLDDLHTTLKTFDTVVLMKVHNVFDEVKVVLSNLGLMEQALYVSRVGMPEERVFRSLLSVTRDALDYFSMVIVRK